MVSAPYARKNGGKTKIAVRAIKAYISKSILPIAWAVTYIYLYRTRRRMARPANARTDTQTGGRTRRSTDRRADGHAEARMQTQAPDGARTLNIRACSAWVEKSSRRVLRLDERTRTFEVYSIHVLLFFNGCPHGTKTQVERDPVLKPRPYLSRISNNASRLLVCNREVERDPVLKPRPVEQYYERVGRNRCKKSTRSEVRTYVCDLVCMRAM